MPKGKDPFWKHVTSLNKNNSKWRCNFCGEEHGGGATRIKAHLAGLGGFGITECKRVDAPVRAEARSDKLMAKKVMDSSDRGVSEERIQGNVTAALTSTWNPPNAEGGTNIQFPQGENISRSMMTLAEVGSHLLDSPYQPQSSIPAPYPVEMQMNDEQTPAGASSFQHDRITVPHSEEPLPGCNEECGTETGSFPLTATHVHLPVLEGEASMTDPLSSSQVQPDLVPLQHHSVPHQSVNHNTRNAQQNSNMHLDNPDTTQHPDLLNHRFDAAHGNEIAYSLQQLGLSSPGPSVMPLLEQPTHLETGNEPQNSRRLSQDGQVLGELFPDEITTDSSDWSNLFDSLPEFRDANVNTHEELQMNGLHNPAVGSSLQNDSSLDVEAVPVPSNISPTKHCPASWSASPMV